MPYDQGAFVADVVDTHRKHFGDEAVDAVGEKNDLVSRMLAGEDLSEEECQHAITQMLGGLLGGAN